MKTKKIEHLKEKILTECVCWSVDYMQKMLNTLLVEQKKEMIKKVNDTLFLNTKLKEKEIDNIILKLL